MSESNHTEIQIRALTGESVTLLVTPTTTLHHLKLLLRHSFPPATTSPNFHLFFKGEKLRLQTQIASYPIQRDEFLVLIPFTKKEKEPSRTSEFLLPNVPHTTNASSSTSELADSTWSSIKEDLSLLRDATESNASNSESGNEKPLETSTERGLSREKQMELPYHLILNTLRDGSEGGPLGEHNCEVFAKVLESVNCLSELPLGHCKLLKRARSKEGGGGGGGLRKRVSDGVICLCPPWLKIVVKAFAFVNIFSAFIYLQLRDLTSSLLEEALSELAKFGVKLGLGDIKNLSLLCPHMVCFRDDVEKTSFGDNIVVLNHSTDNKDIVEENPKRVRKWLYISKTVSTLKRRDSSFRKFLGRAFEQLPYEFGDEMTVGISLEELLVAVKDNDFVKKEDKPKRVKRNKTTSKSDLNHIGCHDTKSLTAVEMIDHLKKGIGSEGQIVHIEDICARKAIYSEIPIDLSEKMRSALKCIGVSKFYCHQAESIQASLHGENVVVATMTSSGKSLCYNLPVLEVLSTNSSSCALYIFPTKALAQDQLRALLHMTKGFDNDFNIGIYDGDTSQSERMWLRDNSRLLITNPDMLHISILPHHQQFSRILSNLRFVVIDETHTYKGAFGSHTALILRRLERLCSYGLELCKTFPYKLVYLNFKGNCESTIWFYLQYMDLFLLLFFLLQLLQILGSILWNLQIYLRWSYFRMMEVHLQGNFLSFGTLLCVQNLPIVDASRIFAEMVQHGLRCIAFCRSRKLCELVLSYTREILHETAPHLVDSICAYRGGYIAEERRKIESSFFGGEICGVAATNALELGIDVGEIDATLHLGFPGSIASLWQQAGRGGRRDKPSLAVYVAFGGPLDQYFMRHPNKLFGRPIECCHVDSQNKKILEQHLVCAAHEHPLSVNYDEHYFGPCLESVIISLKAAGYLSSILSSDSSRIWNYIGPEKLPSHAVNIRAIETVRYSVIDQKKYQVLEEIEESKAFFQVYEGAVYMCQGKTYLVEKLDLSNKTAFCKEADLKYYTKTRDYTDIHVIGGNVVCILLLARDPLDYLHEFYSAYPLKVETNKFPKSNARADICKVTTTWFGFYRIWRGSNQIFDAVDLALPHYSYESQAVWVPVPLSIKEAVVKQAYDFRGGLHAASHAILHVVPLHITCNLSDLAPECPNPHDARFYPERILIYDQHPGGCGISVRVQPYFTKFLEAALELLTCCCCSAEVGCPNCVQSFVCHEYNEVLHKDAAIMIIKGILDAGN
ncbi:uncharacterized protein LOC106756587 isoform X3 [Vigna radiata var. radiata]|uniref:Uncharacterized protein LOC106756587 isoform X3 n=1 Tax=Vigna radiata var. radiata TaxID=3916 RepID=A0A3Q0ES67_VIGRR|nr:uncharacterized protein LOC106756587 isoform X3 [Vigna radiata var. radiata]